MKRLKPPCTEILKDKMNAKLDAGQRQKKKKNENTTVPLIVTLYRRVSRGRR